MNIERIDPDKRWSEAVVHNETVYYTSVPENLDDDATAQTANALAAIDVLLARVGSDKSRILDATIFLANTADFAAMNAAWDAWVVARQRAGALHRAGAADESEVQGGNQNHRRAVSLSTDEKNRRRLCLRFLLPAIRTV